MCISANQQRQKDMARQEAMENTYNVCATGEKKADEYSKYGNVINAE